MESLSLLKLFQIAEADDGVLPAVETDEEEDSFFDLEFTIPNPEHKEHKIAGDVNINGIDSDEKEFKIESPNLKAHHQSPISFLRSPPKLRVFMLFKKPKLEKVEEVPIFSLISGSRSNFSSNQTSAKASSSSKRRLVQKYLKLIKPLYVRASKKNTEISTPSWSSSEKQAPNRVSCRHLGKSRSASSASGIVPSAAVPARRDDSLLLQHDGIQSAILHCKRSYSSSREFSLLSRSASDPSRTSTEEVKKRISI